MGFVWGTGRRGHGTFCESATTHYDTFCLPAESSKVPWARALRLWTSGRGAALCTPGLMIGSHAFDGMASCFAGVVRDGAFWCRGSRATGGLIQECGAHEHQRASAAEAVQRIIEIIFVRLIIVSKGRCRNSGFQGLQQISKLNRRNCQLLPDDGTNRFPQAFVRR